MNWIQEDDFNLLHNMRGAKFGLLQICSAQSANMRGAKVINMLKIDYFAKKNQCTWVLLALHATTGCMAEYFTTAG